MVAPLRNLHDALSPDTLLETLTEAFDTSPYPIRALVLTNPGNPLGQCYNADTLLRCARFCQDRELHLICDEIYALSYFAGSDSGETPFQSILGTDLRAIGCDLSRVHVVWSMSKDFGCSGLRLVSSVYRYHPTNYSQHLQQTDEFGTTRAVLYPRQIQTSSSACAYPQARSCLRFPRIVLQLFLGLQIYHISLN